MTFDLFSWSMRTQALISVMRTVWERAVLSCWLTTGQQETASTWVRSSSPMRSTTASWRSWRRPTFAPWLSWRACIGESCSSSPWSLWTWQRWRRGTGGWIMCLRYLRQLKENNFSCFVCLNKWINCCINQIMDYMNRPLCSCSYIIKVYLSWSD